MKLTVNADGTVTALYRDDLLRLGTPQEVVRASHVDWHAGAWRVTLSAAVQNGADAGRIIGSGFRTYAEAVAFEIEWLESRKI